ncbi:MAG: glycine cleavage system protein GcvH [Alphaproteobacteria bacterium]|nr:glycine cleavage system protein GcvH [Alphaproteobacteria bacterium]
MDIYYSEDHEYVAVDGDVAMVGITDYAQNALGDVVYVELPKVGDTLEAGDQAGVVESVKSASEVYTPVSGEVILVNEALADNPALVNSDPVGDGWFFKIRLSDAAELEDLKDEDGYQDYVSGL